MKAWIPVGEVVMRILKLAKYRLKAQVEKGEGPSGEG